MNTICQKAERSILKTYRERLWNPFIGAVKRYRLIEPKDRIAVCISGGKDSLLLAVLMKLLHRISEVPFEAEYLVMDPGYLPANREIIEQNAIHLELPIRIFQTNIFSVAEKTEHSPCYLCAKMRRGYLYREAQDIGCNKIALGHHMNDVIETTVMGMFYGSQLQAMPPKLRSRHFEGMQLIRPLYCIKEQDILAWQRYNQLQCLGCACRFTENAVRQAGLSKRKEIKELLRELKKQNPNIENSIFHSIHSVCLDTFPGYKANGERHDFAEIFETQNDPDAG